MTTNRWPPLRSGSTNSQPNPELLICGMKSVQQKTQKVQEYKSQGRFELEISSEEHDYTHPGEKK